MKTIVLASLSPRRKELLESIGLSFKVDPPAEYKELKSKSMSAHELVKQNAIGKAQSVAQNYENAIIIGADTVGAFKDHILEKPSSHEDAKRMLHILSGKTHEVLTALCLIDTETGIKQVAVESTRITFVEMSDHDIETYLLYGESMDKAAAYAAQGIGSIFVKSFDGDYFNVVGLPMYRLNLMLKGFDISLIDIVN
ncbi:septum formation protein Maf [Patescibacteria group bacterium]|nr:septum formation protein Maf [Patescibacteria group bacterium]